MSDICQHGLICTLQRLNENPGLERELEALTRERPVALVLPCHVGDLGQPALARIFDELNRAAFLSEIVIPANGLDADGYSRACAYVRERLKIRHRVLWCDDLPVADPGTFRPGKGSNVWFAVGKLIRERACACVLTADTDVTTFRLEMPARLAYALVHPDLHYTFAKSYYPRVTDRIHGRASRLFLAPLLQAVVRAGGHLPLLDFLQSFRYPLAGECGFTLELAASLPFEMGWGLELGMLCDVFRRTDPRAVCQVDAGVRYEHKHQPLGDGERGLVGMCREIARCLFAHLAMEGVRLDRPFLGAVAASYRKEAGEALRRSAALAKINGLQFDEEEESGAVRSFEATLEEAFREPERPDLLPPWGGLAQATQAGA